MKKKSTSKLAFFSLRVLPGLVATAFIAFALARSDAVGDTLLCGNVTTSNCSNPTMTVNVCAHDGSPLVTDIYLKDNARRPVLVLRGCEARCGITAQVLQTIWPPNATYDLVVQDIRGSPFCHERAFIGDLLYKFDQDDSHALLEYIDQQTWSQGANGRIAMNVWSNGGVVNYLAAVGAGASLRGIQTHYATGDLLNYGLFNGGVLHNEIPFPYDLPVKPSWAEYVGWPIWDKYLITDNDAALAKVAGLHVGGWFDVSGQGILDSFSRLQIAGGTGARLNQKVVIGPWTHGGEGSPPVGQIQFPLPTPSNPSLSDYDAKWKKGVLENNWTEWNALPAVKVYLMNAPQGTEWTTYTTWPPPAVEVPFYFTLTRALSRTPQRVNGQLPFTSDPSHPCPTLGGTNNLTSCAEPSPVPCGPWDQRPIEGRSDVVVFTSETDPLGNGGPIVGRIYADVWIATDLPDVDVFVRMTDVYPPDATHRFERSMLMAQGIQRARYWNGACPQLLVPNQPTKVRVDLQSTALVLKPGHKLRVIVSASAGPNHAGGDPLYSVNPQNEDEYTGAHPNVTGSIKVLAGTGHPSALVIPVPTGQTPPPDLRPNTTPCPH